MPLTTPAVTPKPGMIGLTQIAGDVGKGIEIGQWFNGDGFEIWEHAFTYLPGGFILEAEPGGARIVPMHYGEVYWCEEIYKLLPNPLPSDAKFLATAQEFKGVPYSFADYAALSAHRLHLPVVGLKQFIESSKHEICSQMADDYHTRVGGSQIFTDGRWPGFVTPASLYKRDIQLR